MACFTVPMATAAVTVAVEKALPEGAKANPFAARLPWLNKMMLGGSAILALEHVYHGEVVFKPPFLTAMTEGPEAVDAMLREMATRGVDMTVVVFAAWWCMVAFARGAKGGLRQAFFSRLSHFGRVPSTLALVAWGAALMFAVDILADVL